MANLSLPDLDAVGSQHHFDLSTLPIEARLTRMIRDAEDLTAYLRQLSARLTRIEAALDKLK